MVANMNYEAVDRTLLTVATLKIKYLVIAEFFGCEKMKKELGILLAKRQIMPEM